MPNPYVYPRPEYPRPERQRGSIEGYDWINLNGPWQFRFDGDRVGESEKWHQPDEIQWREQIIVPFCWESLAAWGEADAASNENYYATRVFRNPLEVTRVNHRTAPRYEVGWYRRWIEIPANEAWEGKRVILTVGAADFFTDGWLNGKHLGHHEGGYLPFEFDLTEALEVQPDGARRGLLVLRVEDPMDNHEQPVGKQWRWYTTTSGIWQTVFLEPRSESWIEHFQIDTDIDERSVSFAIETRRARPGAVIEIEVTPPNSSAKTSLRVPVQENLAKAKLTVDPMLLWNPNEPRLYRLKLKLLQGEKAMDLIRSYFGMRKIATAPTEDPESPEALCLNGVQRYLRGALYQSFHPDGVYTAGDAATLKHDIISAKNAGFNFLRIHIKIDDPLLLYYADALGIMLMCDFPNFGEGGDTPLGRKRFEEMMRAAVRRDYNHPSIFAWCLFNETWGFGGQVEFVGLFNQIPISRDELDKAQLAKIQAQTAAAPKDAAEAAVARVKLSNQSSHAWVQRMWELAKTLDKTRLIEDMSVVHWEHLDYYAHGDTDINSWHFYMHDYAKAKAHIEKVVNSTFAGSTFNYVDGYKQKKQPLINSEYGGIGALDGDRDISWSFKFLTNELRRHAKISGYIYTEHHDVEWEYNGFLNYDRTPKDFGYDPTIINESDTLPVDAPPIQKCRPGETITIPVSSSHYSSTQRKNVTLRWRLAGVDTLGRINYDLAKGCVPIAFPHRRVAPACDLQIKMPEQTMLCTLSLEAYQGEDGSRVASNFIHIFVSDGYPPSREEVSRSTILRCPPADWRQAEWSIYGGDREEQRFQDRAFGFGHGFFEWSVPIQKDDLRHVRRLRLLCEASSRRIDTPQTDDNKFPTTLQMFLNDLRVYEATLPNHPHDSRGALSYLRGAKGAYGYLSHATIEGDLLRQILERTQDAILLRCAAPKESLIQNGLTIYGAECGRYPVCPTIVIER